MAKGKGARDKDVIFSRKVTSYWAKGVNPDPDLGNVKKDLFVLRFKEHFPRSTEWEDLDSWLEFLWGYRKDIVELLSAEVEIIEEDF